MTTRNHCEWRWATALLIFTRLPSHGAVIRAAVLVLLFWQQCAALAVRGALRQLLLALLVPLSRAHTLAIPRAGMDSPTHGTSH